MLITFTTFFVVFAVALGSYMIVMDIALRPFGKGVFDITAAIIMMVMSLINAVMATYIISLGGFL